MTRTRFARYVWGVLAYNLVVIVWGAYVRATGSGDGCGGHWPFCNGQVMPLKHSPLATLIELSHRLSTTPLLPLALLTLVWAFRILPRRHPARLTAILCLAFTCTEALFGAVLVHFRLVAHNDSALRALVMGAHLTNAFMLLGALALTAFWGSDAGSLPPSSGQGGGSSPLLPRFRNQGVIGPALLLALAATLLLGISGAVTALGDTLFPSKSLLAGLQQDISATAPLYIRLRWIHPLIAVSVGLYLVLIAGLVSHLRPTSLVKRIARWVAGLFLAELGVGALNLVLLAPVRMQLFHLFVADLLWIAVILLSVAALAQESPRIELPEGAPEEAVVAARVTHAATWRDYLALTKPRVISLLLFTTLAAMVIAAHGWPGLSLFLAVAAGGYMAAGAANAINMVIDRDIDIRMARTSRRPTVTQTIPASRALLFAFGLALGSFALLWGAANLLTAMLALAGLAFYVIVYTLCLKRRTWHNIVIGGAAGAFPPLVGWAAVTGHLSVLAWYLFAIIFVWTPVHFWALALLIKDDYARAGIPMLPVVYGERATVLQIGLYAILTAIISLLPFAQGKVGWIYLVAALLLNASLLARSFQLYRSPERRQAVSLFHYSMIYLALLFLIMAVDSAIRI
ncbi:MAG TPA: heme o synthase [Chthonomonadaceae bacterium]|nr:heme o synthase [Chthonomonadaceae bacterium]